jgi:lipopolysaccharide transport system ATP-binding protein
MEPVIKAENISKKFILKHKNASYQTLTEKIGSGLKNIFSGNVKETSEEFWALKNIDFEIQKGDKVGIVGRNGAGKSTLLKVISRIITPTTGKIILHGRVGSLLEVGTGFHPELSGRENIFLNGSILGMSKSEISKRFDEIVEFAEVEKFLDTPVKRYSSGMYVRLAFAVAAHLEPEILIVDEVLAVGDLKFQKKCIGKMEEVSESGRTLLFVSHNMGIVNQLCNKGIYLNNGTIEQIGKASEIVASYLREGIQQSGTLNPKGFNGPLNSKIHFQHLSINQKTADFNFDPKQAIHFEVTGWCKELLSRTRITISIYKGDERVFTLFDTKEPEVLNAGTFKSTFIIPSFTLRPGEYTLALGGFMEGSGEWLYGQNLLVFNILDEYYDGYDFHAQGIINLNSIGKREYQ